MFLRGLSFIFFHRTVLTNLCEEWYKVEFILSVTGDWFKEYLAVLTCPSVVCVFFPHLMNSSVGQRQIFWKFSKNFFSHLACYFAHTKVFVLRPLYHCTAVDYKKTVVWKVIQPPLIPYEQKERLVVFPSLLFQLLDSLPQLMYVYLSKGVFLSEGNCFEESGLSLNEINFENQGSFTMKWFVF